MASIASVSPSLYGKHGTESGDDSESWQYIDSSASSVGFFPSPASGSLNSWAVVGYPNQGSPPAVSPLQLTSPALQHANTYSSSDPMSGSVMAPTSVVEASPYMPASLPGDQQFVAGQESMDTNQFDDSLDMSPYFSSFATEMGNMSGVDGLDNMEVPSQPINFDNLQQFQNSFDTTSWDPAIAEDSNTSYMTGKFNNSWQQLQPAPSITSYSSSSPQSASDAKLDSSKAPSPIRRIKGSGKIEKRRHPVDTTNKFVIMTPNLISASAGKPNPFECFEAMRTTQRGRKGPLANEIKENALQVRRLGACFCCHARKVKCDKERPCKNCKKLSAQVPQIICWQFPDFLPVLFPDFIRGHFKKDQMARFISDNVAGFTIGGVEKTCEVELSAGIRLQSTLTVRANFFTAKAPDVLQHWHLIPGLNQVDLQSRGSAPIGIDIENTALRDELRKRCRDYVQSLIFEPAYAEQVTDAIRHTALPRQVLRIVQTYAQRSESPMVKRALSIFTTHYLLTRHLCLTRSSLSNLQSTTNLMPTQNTSFLTPRLLNRQIKALLDELLLKETQSLFDSFSKSLKPKSRKEWAPCVAAFLILCLFMETIETAADSFVIAQMEIDLRDRKRPSYQRSFALGIVREVENLPFRQFAWQFHQVFQTHEKDGAVKAFNPLMAEEDGGIAGTERNNEYIELLDEPAREMVEALKELLRGDNYYELDFLVADPILPNEETHPFPRDVSLDYTGRLLARFLLSFLDEKYLFDGRY